MINLLGYKYKVLVTDLTDSGYYGNFDGKKSIIKIEQTLCEQMRLSSLLHEIIEGLNWHLELKLEHPKLTSIETGLFEVLTSNGVDLSPLMKQEENE